MKAVRIHEFGDAGVLRVEDLPEPVLGEDEALILVRAASGTEAACTKSRVRGLGAQSRAGTVTCSA